MPRDIAGVMREYSSGNLHSGNSSGPRVSDRKQAMAIALSEQRKMGKKTPSPKDGLKKALNGN